MGRKRCSKWWYSGNWNDRTTFIGHAQPTDYMIFFYLLRIKQRESPPPKEKTVNPDEDGNQPKDEDGAQSGKGKGEEGQGKKKKGDGDAYEENKITPEELAVLMSARRQTAIDFYQQHNPKMKLFDIESHIAGIDFTKPVTVIKVPEGAELIQFTKINTEGTVLRGDYYSDNPNNTPNELGVSDRYNVRDPNNGWQQTDEIRTVNREITIIPKESQGLSSTSAEINDTWSLKNQSVHTDGGGSQIYVPKSQF